MTCRWLRFNRSTSCLDVGQRAKGRGGASEIRCSSIQPSVELVSLSRAAVELRLVASNKGF
jgi:hypothetical protein